MSKGHLLILACWSCSVFVHPRRMTPFSPRTRTPLLGYKTMANSKSASSTAPLARSRVSAHGIHNRRRWPSCNLRNRNKRECGWACICVVCLILSCRFLRGRPLLLQRGGGGGVDYTNFGDGSPSQSPRLPLFFWFVGLLVWVWC